MPVIPRRHLRFDQRETGRQERQSGNLTLHGVTKPRSLKVHFIGAA
jgi:polyisoprenoid-binding protein YceI